MKTKRITSMGILTTLLWVSGSFVFAQVLPEDPSRGGQLFISKDCVKCHALNGVGGKVGPDLGRIDLGDTQLDLAGKIWNHTPSMNIEMGRAGMAKSALTGQDFTEISAYLYFLKFFEEPGKPIQGRNVFFEKGCHFCHQVSGKGKEGAPGLDEFPKNLPPVFFAQAIWNHSLEMMARMVEIGMGWPKFRGTEMMDLLEYIKTKANGPEENAFFQPGNPREGKRVFTDKGCNQCHSIYGEGARGGVDLGKIAKNFYTSLPQIASTMWNKGPTLLVRMAQIQFGINNFTSKEMVDLLAYLYFLRFIDEPGNTANGKRLFSEMGCSQCHGLDGKRGKLMYIDLTKYQNQPSTEIVASMWNHSAQIQKAVGEAGFPWPQFKKREMGDLLEFIRNPEKR
jgi:mono/diheme cytochrome c family protein